MKMKNNLSIFFFITYNIKFRPAPVVWGTKYTKLLIGREGGNEKLMHGLLTKMRNSSSSKSAKNVPEYKRGITIGQSRETGNIGYTRRRQTKQKHNAIGVGQQATRKQT